MLKVWITMVENNPEFLERCTEELVAFQKDFWQVVHLEPGDRLALDTRVKN